MHPWSKIGPARAFDAFSGFMYKNDCSSTEPAMLLVKFTNPQSECHENQYGAVLPQRCCLDHPTLYRKFQMKQRLDWN